MVISGQSLGSRLRHTQIMYIIFLHLTVTGRNVKETKDVINLRSKHIKDSKERSFIKVNNNLREIIIIDVII